MGFFRSLLRFIKTLFGLAEGGTERATDSLLTSSPDAIRNQFRKTREDWVRDYNQMKDSVADLLSIRDDRANQLAKLHKQADDVAAKMSGAIELYKKNKDESLRAKYGKLAEQKTQLEAQMDALDLQIKQQEELIKQYTAKLQELQTSIESLKDEEAETVADIVSTRKLNELNAKLQGLSVDTQSKNLEAIREARQKAKSLADLSGTLSGQKTAKLDEELLSAGQSSKYVKDFDQAVGLDVLLGSDKADKHEDSKGVRELDELFKQ